MSPAICSDLSTNLATAHAREQAGNQPELAVVAQLGQEPHNTSNRTTGEE